MKDCVLYKRVFYAWPLTFLRPPAIRSCPWILLGRTYIDEFCALSLWCRLCKRAFSEEIRGRTVRRTGLGAVPGGDLALTMFCFFLSCVRVRRWLAGISQVSNFRQFFPPRQRSSTPHQRVCYTLKARTGKITSKSLTTTSNKASKPIFVRPQC